MFKFSKFHHKLIIADNVMTDQESNSNRNSISSNNNANITSEQQLSTTSPNNTSVASLEAASTAAAVGYSTASANATTVVPLNNTRKRTPEEYTKNFDLNEISPLRAPSPLDGHPAAHTNKLPTKNGNHDSKGDLNARNGSSAGSTVSSLLLPAPVILNMTSSSSSAKKDDTQTVVDGTFLVDNKRNKFKGTYDDIVGRLDLSERARRPFCVVVVLCAMLLTTVIGMAVFWPRVPAYLWSPVCVDKECMDASVQVSSPLRGPGFI